MTYLLSDCIFIFVGKFRAVSKVVTRKGNKLLGKLSGLC